MNNGGKTVAVTLYLYSAIGFQAFQSVAVRSGETALFRVLTWASDVSFLRGPFRSSFWNVRRRSRRPGGWANEK